MDSPKLRPPVIKQQDEGSTRIIRWCLLVWAILRMIVSVLWAGTIIFGVIQLLRYKSDEISRNFGPYKSRVWIFVYSFLVQLVELGMIVTFITAGIKKSASLYRAYYRYCILTLVIYIILVILCTILDYHDGHYFGDVYLTYHVNELPVARDYFYVLFACIAVFVVGLEILLICLIKILINRYTSRLVKMPSHLDLI